MLTWLNCDRTKYEGTRVYGIGRAEKPGQNLEKDETKSHKILKQDENQILKQLPALYTYMISCAPALINSEIKLVNF